MAGVSYFQRYSQRENHVTNNTLLVLRHLYQSSPSKLEGVLQDLLGDDKISLGPTFLQQVSGTHSVPDALIEQAPFRVYIETKLTQALDLAQLRRHIQTMVAVEDRGATKTVLIGLCTTVMPVKDEEEVAAFARDQGVMFKSVSFAAIAEAVQRACADYEAALRAVVLDYVEFLTAEKLLYVSDDWMLVVPCGVSLEENRRFGVYYDDVDRPKRSPCRFLGLYKDKRVSLVGDIKAVVVCDYRDGRAVPSNIERGRPDPGMIERIREIIEATSYYDLKSRPQRYYVVEKFEQTDLAKVTKGPIRGAQYLQLSPLVGPGPAPASATALAARLNGRSFPPGSIDESEQEQPAVGAPIQ